MESRVGVVRDSRDTAAVIRQLGTAAPLEMFGVSTYSLTHSLTHSLMILFAHSLTHSFAHSLIHSLTHTHTHTHTYSFSHLFSISLPHSLVPVCSLACTHTHLIARCIISQLRHLKRVRKVPSPDSEDGKGSQIEVYICPSTAIGDIPQEVLDYFETPLRTVDVCRVKPRDRADRDAFGEYWPVVFRPTGTKGNSLY